MLLLTFIAVIINIYFCLIAPRTQRTTKEQMKNEYRKQSNIKYKSQHCQIYNELSILTGSKILCIIKYSILCIKTVQIQIYFHQMTRWIEFVSVGIIPSTDMEDKICFEKKPILIGFVHTMYMYKKSDEISCQKDQNFIVKIIINHIHIFKGVLILSRESCKLCQYIQIFIENFQYFQ